MKKYILILFLACLSACSSGGNGGGTSPSPDPDNPPTSHSYRLQVIGSGVQFLGVVYTDFGLSTQVENPIAQHMISGAGYEFSDFNGTNILTQIILKTPGTITVELYKDGVLVDSDVLTQTDITLTLKSEL